MRRGCADLLSLASVHKGRQFAAPFITAQAKMSVAKFGHSGFRVHTAARPLSLSSQDLRRESPLLNVVRQACPLSPPLPLSLSPSLPLSLSPSLPLSRSLSLSLWLSLSLSLDQSLPALHFGVSRRVGRKARP